MRGNSLWAPLSGVVAGLLSLAGCAESPLVRGPVHPMRGRLQLLDTGGPQGDTGWWPSAALDTSGRPHVSYCDARRGDLRYATRSGAGWVSQAVVSAGAVGKYTAIAVDSGGRPAIAFYDQDAQYFSFARPDPAGPWHVERIAWGTEVGMGAAMRFDLRDLPHVLYYVPSGRFVHAWRDGAGEWHKQAVRPAMAGPSARVAAVMRPDGLWGTFVDWRMHETAVYLLRPGGAWKQDAGEPLAVEEVSARTGLGLFSQIVFEGANPVVFYAHSIKGHIVLARRHPDGWQRQLLLEHVGRFVAARHGDGPIFVAYEDTTGTGAGNGSLKLLRRDLTGSWQRYEVDPEGSPGSYLALATGDHGRVLLAYYAKAIHGIKIYEEGG